MKKPKFIPEFDDIPSARQKMPELPLEERHCNFAEVELGLTEDAVLREAARCLSCRRCIGCGLCLAECEPEAVVYDEKPESVTLEADAIVFTSDGKAFDAGRKRDLGYCDSANVITSLEFERIVSPTGPFGGLLVRPFDGDIPRRVAFIQCVGSREEGIGANYCSVQCCSRTLSQARRARELADGIEIHVFHRGLRPTGKRSELDLEDLKTKDWIGFTQAAVTSVKEDPESGTVTVTYEKDEQGADAEFDLVVLAVGVQSLRDFKRWARAGGGGVNKFGFVERNVATLVAGTDEVAFAGGICGPTSGARSVIDALAAASRTAGPCTQGKAAVSPVTEPRNGKPIVFVCEYGLELAGLDRLAVEKLQDEDFIFGGHYPFLCHKDGRNAIRQKMEDSRGLLVIGCHMDSHEELFEDVFGLPRERVAILGKDDLIDDNVEAMTAALERHARRFGGATAGSRPAKVVIVGGGISGLAAAHELTRRDLDVVLIEKSAEIGSPLKEATVAQGGELEVTEGFVKALAENPRLRVLTSSEVASIESSNGTQTVKVATAKGEDAIEAGAILIATGTDTYQPRDYRQNGSVMTQQDFGAAVARGEKAWKRLVMIQCVGARDRDHPYCSRFCCRQALTNALHYKEENPEAEITILHRGIRVFGVEEELYTDAMERGIVFAEVSAPPGIEPGPGTNVIGTSREGEAVKIQCDAVVLSVGHCHGADHGRLAKMTGVPLDDLGFFTSGNAFGDPFATPVEGVFVCGFARSPVIADDAFVDGLGAAGSICKFVGA